MSPHELKGFGCNSAEGRRGWMFVVHDWRSDRRHPIFLAGAAIARRGTIQLSIKLMSF